MKVYNFKNDPKVLLEQGQELAKSVSCDKYRSRIVCVNLYLCGELEMKKVSQLTGASRTSLWRWVKAVDNKGWESLKDSPHTGRKSRLSANDKQQIIALIDEDNPEKYGYDVWDTRTMADYIRKTYTPEYGQSATAKLMKSLGLALVRPTTYPSLENPDPEAEEEFKQKLQSALDDPSTRVCFQDEVHFQLQPRITWKWTRKGTKLRVMSRPGKESVAYSGFVFPDTGELFVTKPTWFNYKTVIQCFEALIESHQLPEGVRFCVVLDNAPWHQKAIRLIWGNRTNADKDEPDYSHIREKMCYLRLPPYCPHLNPIEQVWRITRREATHNRYFPSLIDLTEKLDKYFARYAQPNEKFWSLCNFNFSIVDENGEKVKPERKPRPPLNGDGIAQNPQPSNVTPEGCADCGTELLAG